LRLSRESSSCRAFDMPALLLSFSFDAMCCLSYFIRYALSAGRSSGDLIFFLVFPANPVEHRIHFLIR
jgi:hypothetical protein